MVLSTAVSSSNSSNDHDGSNDRSGPSSRTPVYPVNTWLENDPPYSALGHSPPGPHRSNPPLERGRITPSVRTSRLTDGATGITPGGSLPGLAYSTATVPLVSIATGRGARDVDRQQRIFEDGNQAGASTATYAVAGILECPFRFIFGCRSKFGIGNVNIWYHHSLTHFKLQSGGDDINPPLTTKCAFCPRIFEENVGTLSWWERLAHTRVAHHMNGHTMVAGQSDIQLATYLRGAGVIDGIQHHDISARLSTNSPPSTPDDEEPRPIIFPARTARRPDLRRR